MVIGQHRRNSEMYYVLKFISPVNGEPTTAIINDEGWQIPADEMNADYRAYLTWIDEGNSPEEWIDN